MERDTILHIHSILGVLVFVSGFLNISLKKGGRVHRIVGKIYLIGWIALLISGAYLGGVFMTTIGIFGFYFTLTGARIGRLKMRKLKIFDKLIFILGGLTSIVLILYAVTLFMQNQTSYAIIFTVFGGIFLFTTVEDIAKYVLHKPLRKQIYGNSDWFFEHLIRMCISFIAAITAFTSIQDVFKNNTLNFLLPTVAGVILIRIGVMKYRKDKGFSK